MDSERLRQMICCGKGKFKEEDILFILFYLSSV